MKGDGRKLFLFRTVDHTDMLRNSDIPKTAAECGAAHEGNVAVWIPGVPHIGAAKAFGKNVVKGATAGCGAGVTFAVVEIRKLREYQAVHLAEGAFVKALIAQFPDVGNNVTVAVRPYLIRHRHLLSLQKEGRLF